MNRIFVLIVPASLLFAIWFGKTEQLSQAIVEDAKKAVWLAIGLVGVMSLFLGLMKVAEAGGLMRILARAAAPVMRRLFPDVPVDHPAMSAMLLNIAANMMGLANAATPFGIRAMEQLDRLNTRKGTATNAMVLFLAINTAGLAILPTGVIGLRAAAGSADAAGIFFPTWFASGSATIVGILAAFALSRLPAIRREAPPPMSVDDTAGGDGSAPGSGSDANRSDPANDAVEAIPGVGPPPPAWLSRLVGASLLLGAAGLTALHLLAQSRGVTPHDLAATWWAGGELGAVRPVRWFDVTRDMMSYWTLSIVVVALVLFGWFRGVRVYEVMVDGAREGFQVALRIIPFLVSILVAVGMFRASGGIDLLAGLLAPVTSLIGMPAEALPMALIRPLSGSGAMGVMTSIMEAHGPDSFIGYMVSTFQGSTETTFYVLAVYFGAVGVKNTRHALPACLLADLAGILAAVFIVHLFFG